MADIFECWLCSERDTKKNLQCVKSGISTLIMCAESLEEKELTAKFRKAQESNNSNEMKLHVHNLCRKSPLNRANAKTTPLSSPEVTPKRRQSNTRLNDQEFDWKKYCFLCAKLCKPKDDKHINEKEKWSLCKIIKQQVGKDQPAYTKNIILETIGDRTDEEAVAIKRRLLTCSDLPAVDARYHIVCRKKLDREFLHFQRDKSPTFSATKQRGRPKNDFQIKNFNALCQLLEEDCDLYSVAELHEKMRLLSDNPNDSSQIFSSKQYLKKILKEKYADEILFTDHANKSDVVFFKWNANRIINDTWYNQRIANAEDESTRIIKTAAKLIQMQLRSTDYDIISYPSTEIIGDLKSNKEWMPPLLQVFMECLVKDELKQASIGQTLVHAARPKSSIPPIMFGTAIDCDHMFG